jgi:uncharacterized protein YjiS (DUF1127 family)
MSAQFAKDQVSYFAPANLSESAPTVFAPANENKLAAGVRAVAAWASGLVKRRAVMNELSMLSDHELADIGLSRSEIPRVFDRAFVASRSAPQAARA